MTPSQTLITAGLHRGSQTLGTLRRADRNPRHLARGRRTAGPRVCRQPQNGPSGARRPPKLANSSKTPTASRPAPRLPGAAHDARETSNYYQRPAASAPNSHSQLLCVAGGASRSPTWPPTARGRCATLQQARCSASLVLVWRASALNAQVWCFWPHRNAWAIDSERTPGLACVLSSLSRVLQMTPREISRNISRTFPRIPTSTQGYQPSVQGSIGAPRTRPHGRVWCGQPQRAAQGRGGGTMPPVGEPRDVVAAASLGAQRCSRLEACLAGGAAAGKVRLPRRTRAGRRAGELRTCHRDRQACRHGAVHRQGTLGSVVICVVGGGGCGWRRWQCTRRNLRSTARIAVLRQRVKHPPLAYESGSGELSYQKHGASGTGAGAAGVAQHARAPRRPVRWQGSPGRIPGRSLEWLP